MRRRPRTARKRHSGASVTLRLLTPPPPPLSPLSPTERSFHVLAARWLCNQTVGPRTCIVWKRGLESSENDVFTVQERSLSNVVIIIIVKGRTPRRASDYFQGCDGFASGHEVWCRDYSWRVRIWDSNVGARTNEYDSTTWRYSVCSLDGGGGGCDAHHTSGAAGHAAARPTWCGIRFRLSLTVVTPMCGARLLWPNSFSAEHAQWVWLRNIVLCSICSMIVLRSISLLQKWDSWDSISWISQHFVIFCRCPTY